MTEHPILFSAPMVRAILDGRKTQTRRIVKWRGSDRGPSDAEAKRLHPAGFMHETGFDGVRCPFGKPGDRLWVRETWAPCEAKVRQGHIHYAADGAVGHEVTTNGGDRWWERSGHTLGLVAGDPLGVWVSKPSRWRPSIHMPRWASRLTLEVTAVRVERLQDISEEDARAEGARHFPDLPGSNPYASAPRWSMEEPTTTDECLGSARMAFANYWNKTVAGENWNLKGEPEPWAFNPWVWVVEFRRLP